MTTETQAVPDASASITAFPNTQAESMRALERQLENIQTALAQRYGALSARLMLGEAALRLVASSSRQAGTAFATRFALEVELNQLFGTPGAGGDAA